MYMLMTMSSFTFHTKIIKFILILHEIYVKGDASANICSISKQIAIITILPSLHFILFPIHSGFINI